MLGGGIKSLNLGESSAVWLGIFCGMDETWQDVENVYNIRYGTEEVDVEKGV